MTRTNGPRHIEKAAGEYPDAIFIMGHSAPGELDDAIAVAKRHENVYLDLCDIHRHSGIVDKIAGLSAQSAFCSERTSHGTIRDTASEACCFPASATRINIRFSTKTRRRWRPFLKRDALSETK